MIDTNTLAPTDAEILALLPTVKLKDEDPKRMVWLTRKDALKFARAVLAKWGAPAAASQPVAATAGMEPVAHLIERSAFRVSPHGQDAESNEWLEEAHSPDEPGAFAVFTAAQVQAMGRVAPGWKAVPVEPTCAMTHIGQQLRHDSANSIAAIYRAMLAAAPSGPARVPLTNEQIEKLCAEIGFTSWTEWDGDEFQEMWMQLARAIEAAHCITAAQDFDQPDNQQNFRSTP